MPKVGGSAQIRIGQPIDVARYKGRDGDHLVYRELTDELMYEIRELTGQHYIDRYATKKAETLPTDVAKVRLSEPVEHERELARAG
jgi:1-acyl-sn-glycerol-3-phosphate acyltransferase